MYIILYIEYIYLKNTVHEYVQWMYTFYNEYLQLCTFNVHVFKRKYTILYIQYIQFFKECTQFYTFKIYKYSKYIYIYIYIILDI